MARVWRVVSQEVGAVVCGHESDGTLIQTEVAIVKLAPESANRGIRIAHAHLWVVER